MAMVYIPKGKPKYETVCKPEDVELMTKMEMHVDEINNLLGKFPTHDEKLTRYRDIIGANATIMKEILKHKADCFMEFVDIPKLREKVEDIDEHLVNIETFRRRYMRG